MSLDLVGDGDRRPPKNPLVRVVSVATAAVEGITLESEVAPGWEGASAVGTSSLALAFAAILLDSLNIPPRMSII